MNTGNELIDYGSVKILEVYNSFLGRFCQEYSLILVYQVLALPLQLLDRTRNYLSVAPDP